MISWKRVVMTGIALWVLIFFEVSILMFGFNLQTGNPNYYFIHALLLTAFIIVLSLIYFKEKKVKKGLVEGIVLGIVFVVVGVILDSVITIPLFIIPRGGSYTGFLFSPEMLLSYLGIIILSGIIGLIKKGKI